MGTDKKRRKIGFLPALIISAAVIILYQIFKTPELDREVEKLGKKFL